MIDKKIDDISFDSVDFKKNNEDNFNPGFIKDAVSILEYLNTENLPEFKRDSSEKDLSALEYYYKKYNEQIQAVPNYDKSFTEYINETYFPTNKNMSDLFKNISLDEFTKFTFVNAFSGLPYEEQQKIITDYFKSNNIDVPKEYTEILLTDIQTKNYNKITKDISMVSSYFPKNNEDTPTVSKDYKLDLTDFYFEETDYKKDSTDEELQNKDYKAVYKDKKIIDTTGKYKLLKKKDALKNIDYKKSKTALDLTNKDYVKDKNSIELKDKTFSKDSSETNLKDLEFVKEGSFILSDPTSSNVYSIKGITDGDKLKLNKGLLGITTGNPLLFANIVLLELLSFIPNSAYSTIRLNQGNYIRDVVADINDLFKTYKFAPENNHNFFLDVDLFKLGESDERIQKFKSVTDKMELIEFINKDTRYKNKFINTMLMSASTPVIELTVDGGPKGYGLARMNSYISGFKNDGQLELKFLADDKWRIYNIFTNWQMMSYNLKNYTISYPNSYKSDIFLFVYTNYQNSVIARQNPIPQYTEEYITAYYFKDCFVTKVSRDRVNASKMDEISTSYVSVNLDYKTFTYSYATVHNFTEYSSVINGLKQELRKPKPNNN